MDKYTEQRISKLHPSIRQEVSHNRGMRLRFDRKSKS